MMHPGRGPRQGRVSSREACSGRGIIGTMPVPRPGTANPVRRAMSTHHSDPWRWRELVARELRLAPAVHEVPVREAAGRVLASAVRSPEDVPAVAVSAMDGFAVRRADLRAHAPTRDRKSTRLNSSHVSISYAVFCLKKKRTEADKR